MNQWSLLIFSYILYCRSKHYEKMLCKCHTHIVVKPITGSSFWRTAGASGWGIEPWDRPETPGKCWRSWRSGDPEDPLGPHWGHWGITGLFDYSTHVIGIIKIQCKDLCNTIRMGSRSSNTPPLPGMSVAQSNATWTPKGNWIMATKR